MENQIKRIGVLTSGGDAPGMNAAVRAVVRSAVGRGIDCIGIRRGWNGLINSDFIHMNASSVSHIINKKQQKRTQNQKTNKQSAVKLKKI